MNLRDAIVELDRRGLSHRQIANYLECSKGTVSYYLTPGERERSIERKRQRRATTSGAVRDKIDRFATATCANNEDYGNIREQRSPSRRRSDKIGGFQKTGKSQRTFEWTDLLDKYGTRPVCYLTGDPIDWDDPSSYEFDHMIPVAKGGGNTLDNLGLATKAANRAKHDMDFDDFVELCCKVAARYGKI